MRCGNCLHDSSVESQHINTHDTTCSRYTAQHNNTNLEDIAFNEFRFPTPARKVNKERQRKRHSTHRWCQNSHPYPTGHAGSHKRAAMHGIPAVRANPICGPPPFRHQHNTALHKRYTKLARACTGYLFVRPLGGHLGR